MRAVCLAISVPLGGVALAAGMFVLMAFAHFREKHPTDDPDPLNSAIAYGIVCIASAAGCVATIRAARRRRA